MAPVPQQIYWHECLDPGKFDKAEHFRSPFLPSRLPQGILEEC